MSETFYDFLTRLADGDDEAARTVLDRYGERLIRIARSRLDPRLLQKFDAEDVMQSVFRSFFRRNADGDFEMKDWDHLWAILVVITRRKCGRRRRRYRAGARDLAKEVNRQPPSKDEDRVDWEATDREPTPDEALALTELVQQLMTGLNDRERETLTLRLQGFTVAEISQRVGRTERTVHRTLAQLRRRATRILDDDH